MFKKGGGQPRVFRRSLDRGFDTLNKERNFQSIKLKKINDSIESSGSSLAGLSLRSSLKNLGNSSVISSERSSFFTDIKLNSRIIAKQKEPFEKKQMKNQVKTKQEELQNLLERYFDQPIIKSLMQFINKNWLQQSNQLLAAKKLQAFLHMVVHRSNLLNQIIEDFMSVEYEQFNEKDKKTMSGVLFKQSSKTIKEMETLIVEVIKKIPEEKILQQQGTLEELYTKLLDIYNPKFIYSNQKMKERVNLFQEEYLLKKNNLKSQICTKLKINLDILVEIQKYFFSYQKQLIRLKNQVTNLEVEKNNIQNLLQKKVNVNHIEIDYQKLRLLKEKASSSITNDLDNNIVKFHTEKHKNNQKVMAEIEKESNLLKKDIEKKSEEILRLKTQIDDWIKSIPKKKDSETQVYLITKKNTQQGSAGSSAIATNLLFLENVVTPFSFNQKICGSLINIISIDKILFDYEVIRNRHAFVSFQDFLFEWFIIKTGCKKIAQIFIKNFLYSIKQYKTRHKRFNTFNKICGFSGYRKKNTLQDLQYTFFQTSLCWFYIVKLSMFYRKKLNENPTGYHIFPPLECEEIFKLPLRKTYDIIEQFFISEDIEIPPDMTQKIDHYAINEISKFKSNDDKFQKELLEEIHILRQLNFDYIVGFILEYIATSKSCVVEKLLRTIDNKQKEDGNVLGYSDFEAIYKRFYKEKRSKIELVYSKFCLINQHDILDIENARPVVLSILEDQYPLRCSFDKLESLKMLILSQKANIMKNDKKVLNPNSFQNFRERYYFEFYDFYNTTALLEDLFKITKNLIRKRLKKISKNQNQIQSYVEVKFQDQEIENKKQKSDDSEQEEESQQETQKSDKKKSETPEQVEKKKDFLVSKLEQWSKIVARIPHFTSKVLTIEQIIIHNMRRKEFIQACEFAWKTLRQILSVLGKQ